MSERPDNTNPFSDDDLIQDEGGEIADDEDEVSEDTEFPEDEDEDLNP